MSYLGTIIVASHRKGGTPVPEGFKLLDVSRNNPVLGNKFEMRDKSEAERQRVIAAFADSLRADFISYGPMLQACIEIAQSRYWWNTALVCWCSPLACHADVLRTAILWLSTDEGRDWLFKKHGKIHAS